MRARFNWQRTSKRSENWERSKSNPQSAPVADAREVIVRWGGSLVSVESLREDMTLRSVLVAGYTVFLV